MAPAQVSGAPSSPAPSAWIARFAPLIRPGARALDLAAGQGRHALYLAARGVKVLAVDRDADALSTFAGAGGIETRAADIEHGPWPLPGERFDAIVVVRYLHRPLLGQLLAALTDDGVLLYETFARGNEAYGKPSNPAFLLEPDELLALARERLTVVAFEQGAIGGTRPAVIQRLAAVGRRRAWPPLLSADGLE